MDNTIKIALAAAGSFIAGYLVADARSNKYYSNIANEEIAEVKERYEGKLSDYKKSYAEHSLDLELKTDPTLREAAEALVEYRAEMDEAPVKPAFVPVDIHEYAEKIPYSSYSNVDADKEQPRDVADPLQPNIETITADEFIENEVGYEQHSLQYYFGDNVLVDGLTGEKIEGEGRTSIVGRYDDVLGREGFWEGLKADEWYLRHHDLRYDYEIIHAAGKHADEVAGDIG